MEAERVRIQLDRILASATFAGAERGQKFLRFVVELALAGRADEIKESVVAVEVLGRATSFDPRTDPIVRVEAGRLRSRLVAYYQGEGSGDPVLVDLPKGGYVPQFQERKLLQQTSDPTSRVGRLPLLLGGAALFGFLLSWAVWRVHDQVPALRERALLSVLPPEGSRIGNSAISPDGRHLAFTATSGNSTQLWIRSLDSLEARALPGTDRAAYPFWSPDGKSIAFFSAGKLQKINVSGGPPQAVCDTPEASFGGTWGTREDILFASRPSGSIYQVSAHGGKSRTITVPDVARGEISHLFPYFLPDGRHFLFSVISRGPAESSVRLGSLDSRDTSFLLNARIGAAYAPPYSGHPGTLMFAYNGALMSQAFDLNRMQLTGPSSQIAREVRQSGSRADFSVSSNGALAYQGDSEKDRQLTWFDRDGRRLGTVGQRNADESFALSPDEKRLAIGAVDPASGRSEIWIMDLDRGSLSRLGVQATEGFLPIWAPNGRAIVFSGESGSGMNLMRQPIDNISAASLLVLEGLRIATDWSTDGKFITYTMPSSESTGLTVWLAPTQGALNNGGRTWSIAGHSSTECCATFSPALTHEGPRWIAWSSDESGQHRGLRDGAPRG